jgi:hypothetical protein
VKEPSTNPDNAISGKRTRTALRPTVLRLALRILMSLLMLFLHEPRLRQVDWLPCPAPCFCPFTWASAP